MADIKFLVEVDTAKGTAAVKSFEGEISKLSTTTKQQLQPVSTLQASWGKLTAAYAVGMAAVAAVSGATRKLTEFMGDCIKGAIDEEKAERSLQLSLETTGRTVAGNLKHYLGYAQSLHNVTLYTHEQVQASQTLLLQLTNLDQKGIDAATRGAIGLASVFGIDLHSATMLVAKAMEGNYGALARYGIKVSETLPLEQKNAQLLEQLAGFYTRATGETETFGGSITQLKKSFDEMKEAIGTAITQSGDLKVVLGLLKLVIDDVARSISGQNGAFGIWSMAIQAVTDQIKSKFGPVLLFLAVEGAKHEKMIRDSTAAYDALKPTLKTVDDWLLKHGIDVAASTGLWQRNKTIVVETGNAHDTLGKKLKAVKEAIDPGLNLAVGELTNSYTALEEMALKVSGEIENSGNAFDKAKEQVDNFKLKVEEVPDATKNVADTTRRYIQEVSTVWADAMRNIARAIVDLLGITKSITYQARAFNNAYFEKARSDYERDTQARRDAINDQLDALRDFYDKQADELRRSLDDAQDALREEFDAKEKAARRAYEDRRDWIMENVKDEKTRNAMLKKLERDHEDWVDALHKKEKNKLAALEDKYQKKLDALRAEQEKKEKALADQLKKIQEDYQKEMERIRADEDRAREWHAKREEGRQKTLWNSIKGIFAKVVEEMLVIWLTKFIGKVLSSILDIGSSLTSVLSSAAKSVAGAVGGIASGAASALSGLWTGLGAAVGTFLGSIFGKKPNMGDVTYWLKLIWENTQNMWNSIQWFDDEYSVMNAQLNDIKETGWDFKSIFATKIDKANKYLHDILEGITNLPSAQHGGTLVRDALVKAHAGETIVPAGKASPVIIRFNIGGETIDLKSGIKDLLINLVPELSRDGRLKFYAKGIV